MARDRKTREPATPIRDVIDAVVKVAQRNGHAELPFNEASLPSYLVDIEQFIAATPEQSHSGKLFRNLGELVAHTLSEMGTNLVAESVQVVRPDGTELKGMILHRPDRLPAGARNRLNTGSSLFSTELHPGDEIPERLDHLFPRVV